MDPRLYMLGGTFALLVIALVATIVSAVRAARRKRYAPDTAPATPFEWPALPPAPHTTVDHSLEGLQLDVPADSPSAALLTPLRTGEWQPPEEPAPAASLPGLALGTRVASYEAELASAVSLAGTADGATERPGEASDAVEAPLGSVTASAAGESQAVPEPIQTQAVAMPIAASTVPQGPPPAPAFPRADRPIPVTPDLQAAVPAVTESRSAQGGEPLVPVPTDADSVAAERLLTTPEWAALLPEVAAVTPKTAPAAAALPTPPPESMPHPELPSMLERVSAWAPESVPVSASEAAPTPVEAYESVAAPPVVVAEPGNLPTTAAVPLPVTEPVFDIVAEPMSEVRAVPEAEPFAWIAPEASESSAVSTPAPEPVPDDSFWETAFREQVDLPSVIVATAPVAPAPAPAPAAPAPSLAPAPAAMEPAPASAPAPAAPAPAPPAPSPPPRAESSRPRTVVRSLDAATPPTGTPSRVNEPLAPSVAPPREAVTTAVLEEIVLAAPVEMWFGESRIGVKAGTKTYAQFRKYADVLFGDLKAAKGHGR